MTFPISPAEPPWPRSAVRSLRWLSRLLRIWRSPNRRFLNIPPGHFYSPLPDAAELERDVGRIYPPQPCPPLGVDLNADGQLRFVVQTAGAVSRIDWPARPHSDWRYRTDNTYFPIADAVPLAAILDAHRPARVVEIGSGFSTACALDLADRLLPGRVQFTCVEPYPDRLRSLLRAADHDRVQLHPHRVQDLSSEVFAALDANDVLFIDSSHVSKVGSDVNHLLFDVLPALRRGVLVHVHDIFWPFEYPPNWLAEGRVWNEAYLMRAFLYANSHFRVRYFGSYLEAVHPQALYRHWPRVAERAASNPAVGSASLWLEKVA
jgi:predicted O-methyltransferase YrrM